MHGVWRVCVWCGVCGRSTRETLELVPLVDLVVGHVEDLKQTERSQSEVS